MDPQGDDWDTWETHVLAELKRLAHCIESMQECLVQVKMDISALKVKSGIWGFVAGLIPTVGAAIWFIVRAMH